jgi:hypothetical protein
LIFYTRKANNKIVEDVQEVTGFLGIPDCG